MVWDADRVKAHIGGISPVEGQISQKAPEKAKGEPGAFKKALESATASSAPNVKISAHASQRLMQRGITLDTADLQKIDTAMNQAAEKGAKESLFMLRDLALVVGIESRTVITALHGESAKQNVFTNIDSAVIL